MWDPQTASTAVPLPAEQIQQLVAVVDKLHNLIATALSAGGAGFVGSKLLETVKNSQQFRFLQHTSSTRAKQLAGGIMAFVTSLGVGFAAAWSTNGDLNITISGLAAGSIISHAGKFAVTWLAQQIWYQGLIKQPQLGTLVAPPPPAPQGGI